MNRKYISRGQFASVYREYDDKVGNFIVVKEMSKKHGFIQFGSKKFSLEENEIENIFNNEVQILSYLNNLHSVYFPKYYGSYEDETNYYIREEYIKGIPLTNFIKNISTYECGVISQILWQIYDMFLILDENNIYYFDLNKDNILVTETFDIKLIDFGLTCGIINCKKTFAERLIDVDDLNLRKLIFIRVLNNITHYIFSFIINKCHEMYEEFDSNEELNFFNKYRINSINQLLILDVEDIKNIFAILRDFFKNNSQKTF